MKIDLNQIPDGEAQAMINLNTNLAAFKFPDFVRPSEMWEVMLSDEMKAKIVAAKQNIKSAADYQREFNRIINEWTENSEKNGLTPAENDMRLELNRISREFSPSLRRAEFLRYLSKLRARRRELQNKIAVLTERQSEIADDQEVIDDVRRWIRGIEESGAEIVLEKNECSRLHHVKESMKTGLLFADVSQDAYLEALNNLKHTFVVKHDWGRAFAQAEGISDEFSLPYDLCAFEFRIRGRTLVAFLRDPPERDHLFFSAEGIKGTWIHMNCVDVPGSKLLAFVWSQIRAICIGLDSEITTATRIAAPARLNSKRTRSGKTPLLDYYVVDLSQRVKRSPSERRDYDGLKTRLHFRRGHNRYLGDGRKIKVKWCMVGNPDLGFVDKHYLL